MKKLVITALLLLGTLIFAQEWYSGKEKIDDFSQKISSKESEWFGYGKTPNWVLRYKSERATYFNVNDFGLEYPVSLDSISSYLYDSLCTYNYKIYDKDGATVLFESDPLTAFKGYNDLGFATPKVINDDFWFSIVPQEDGLPGVVSTDVIDSYHSFYGHPGEWLPLPEESKRYELMNFVLLSPYVGTDTYGPSVRSVTGLQNFMFADANIYVSLQDQSVISVAYGEYDIGAGWVQFPLTANKASYSYLGIVPGQDTGVNAKIRIYAEDEFGNNTTSDEYTVSWSKELPLVKEGFESTVYPPSGWTLQTAAGTGFQRWMETPTADIYEGRALAVHMDEPDNCDNWIISPKLSIPNQGFCTLFFAQYGWFMQYIASSVHEVCVSEDMVNWDVIYTGYPPTGETGSGGVWERIIYPLNAYADKDIYIGFHFAAYYEDRWYLDDISVLFDENGPVITEIKGNEALLPVVGAYLDNPINLYVKTSDLSGTASVTANYDIGGQTGTLVFSEIKAEVGLWTATIPAQAAEAVGDIDFTLIDIGGISSSCSYEIKFVPDEAAPVITAFSYGNPVLTNQDMTISLNLEDESGISSVTCYYSKDNWGSETPYVMTLSKMHEYFYQCVIPAETVETFAEVRFEMSDAPGNTLNSGTYTVKWLLGLEFVYDDFESGQSAFWDWTTPLTTWAITSSESVSPSNSLTDSPAGNYPDATKNRIMTNPMDFTGFLAVSAYYWTKIDVEPEWEYTKLQATTSTVAVPADAEWVTLAQYDGYENPWQYNEVNMGSLADLNNVRLRLAMDSDGYVNGDGAYIDNFRIVGFYKDYAAPIIIYDGPEKMVGSEYYTPREFTIPVGLGDYIFNVELIDLSDISEVKVVYSVDGGPELESIPTVSSGPSGIYELTIPDQPAGSQISYKVVATDNSEYYNVGETKNYIIHFGNFLDYYNGDDYMDYLDIIGPSNDATAQAIAVRITMGPKTAKGHYRSDLVGITIQNYVSVEDGYPSDPMYVHVWEDAYGVPGKDLIAPIYTIQAAVESSYEITYVDLRPYAGILSAVEGDIFVGYTSAGQKTNLMYEVIADHISVPEYVPYYRSWLGTQGSEGLEWELDSLSVYWIGAVIGDYDLIDAPLPPRGFTATTDTDAGLGQVTLNWLESNEGNIDHYNVYRGVTAGFAPVTPLTTVTFGLPTTYVDTPPVGGGDVDGYFYYKITAVDTGANESNTSLELRKNPTVGIEEILPVTTQLYQNYPNPFNPETTIKFNIAENAKVNLSVYNSKGETVANLVNENLERGSYSIMFNGSKLTSGVYYTVMKVNSKVMTGKMIMLK